MVLGENRRRRRRRHRLGLLFIEVVLEMPERRDARHRPSSLDVHERHVAGDVFAEMVTDHPRIGTSIAGKLIHQSVV